MTDSKFDLTFEKRTASPFLRLLGLRKSSNHGAISRVFLTGSWHAIFDRSFPFNFQSIRWFSLVYADCSAVVVVYVCAELFETFYNFFQKNMAGRQFRIYLGIYLYIGCCCPWLLAPKRDKSSWNLPSFRGGLWACWAVEILIRQPIAKLSKKSSELEKLNENNGQYISIFAFCYCKFILEVIRSQEHQKWASQGMLSG